MFPEKQCTCFDETTRECPTHRNQLHSCEDYYDEKGPTWFTDNLIPNLQIVKCKCVKTPERAYKWDAGIDFFIPNFEKPIALFPQQRRMIPSGIHAKIPHGYMLKAEDKSGVGIKKGLKYIGGVIDEGYMGEINICLFNTSDEKVMIHAGEKIIQFILIPVLYSKVELINSLEELYPEKTERGKNGFGSTNN